MVAAGFTDWVPPVAARLYVDPSVPVTVTCVAWVATTVRTAVCPVAIEVGLAVSVIAGFLRVLLPTNNSHAERRRQRAVSEEPRSRREIRLDVCFVGKVLSLFSRGAGIHTGFNA